MGAGDASDRRRRIDQAAVGRDMRDGDQLDVMIDHAFEGVEIEFSRGVARDDVDHGPGAAGNLQEGNVIAGVLGLGGEDAIAGGEADGIERHVPGDRGVLDEGDFTAVGVQELRDRIVDRFDLVVGGRGGFVASSSGFELEMAQLCLHDGRRHQGRTRIVEMQDAFRCRRVPARALDVDRHGRVRCLVPGNRSGHGAEPGCLRQALAKLGGRSGNSRGCAGLRYDQ